DSVRQTERRTGLTSPAPDALAARLRRPALWAGSTRTTPRLQPGVVAGASSHCKHDEGGPKQLASNFLSALLRFQSSSSGITRTMSARVRLPRCGAAVDVGRAASCHGECREPRK